MRYRTLLRKGIKGITPGDETHNRMVTASKISATAIPSRSPYESYFSLWHKMAGTLPWGIDSEADQLVMGNMQEPIIADWFAYKHPEFNVRDPKSRVWIAPEHSLIGATPDRIIEQGGDVVALLEIKHSRSDGWGKPGTEEIPDHYYDQVQLQMHCTGVHKTYVQALVYGTPKEYMVQYAPEHAEALINGALSFLEALAVGEQPNITDPEHLATYEAVRALHDNVQDEQVELPANIAVAYLGACEHLETAKKEQAAAKTILLDAMGDSALATCAGHLIAKRSQNKNGVISLTNHKSRPKAAVLREETRPKNNPFHVVEQKAA